MKIQKLGLLLSKLLLSMLLLFTMLPIIANAEVNPSFSLSSSISNAKIGDEVVVNVEGHNVKNIFGYELRLSYDSNVLKFRQASTTWEGFTVPSIVEDGNIIFAHTRVGNAAGESGDVHFASLRFEAISQGDASIQLKRVKLVDDGGSSATYELGQSLKVAISGNYLDTKGHWADENIVRATAMGWIKGYPDGTFAPNKEVTRAEFTTMLSRALALSSPTDQAQTFEDDEQIPQFAKSHISQAVAAGLVKGYDDATFRPSHWINRSEMTVMLVRVLGYDKLNNSSPTLTYDDAEQVPEWAYSAIATATDMGIVKGRGKNKFAPSGYSTRAEAVTLILRIIDHIASTSKVN
ncbi:MAG: S-layer homology domain-containing protein [Candidatus Pristimantibacillus lignocellulolyticus]|uniref:S-layer homology domain-containing protein n=1 Tax=Candidatus Pristimantibacillus lignocellulolyticus TaxID=2994561 RepID=A0A9J6ZK67_9BACL|nr:MAG: S-layer homology domain-containing protein [Candidatus Pristimantibacillus lignocellulolyticus]